MKTVTSPSQAHFFWLWGPFVCFFSLGFFTMGMGFAEETSSLLPSKKALDSPDTSPYSLPSDPSPEINLEKKDFLERFHYACSMDVVKTAYWLDSFFGGTRIDEETKESRLRLNVSLQLVKNKKSVLRSDAGLKLVLPHLENRFQFLFGGESEEAFNSEKPVSHVLRDLNKTENYSSALRYVLLAARGWDTSLDGGMKLHSHPIFFARMRVRKTIESEHWVFRPTERFTLYEEAGLESVSSVDFDRKIREDLFFRITPAATWTEESDTWVLNPSVSVFRQWDDRRAAAFVFGVSLSTEPTTRVEEYAFKVKYRQKIKGDWLFVEVVPELSFPHEEDFEVVPKIQFKIEAIFGNLD